MSALDAFLVKWDAEEVSEMKRRHFIMLAKGREEMRAFLISLGMHPRLEQIVEVEKAFYLAHFTPEEFGLEGPYEHELHASATALVETLKATSTSLEKVNAICSHLAVVEGGREEGALAVRQVVDTFLETMATTYQAIPETMKDDAREAATSVLAEWEDRFLKCGMDSAAAEARVFG